MCVCVCVCVCVCLCVSVCAACVCTYCVCACVCACAQCSYHNLCTLKRNITRSRSHVPPLYPCTPCTFMQAGALSLPDTLCVYSANSVARLDLNCGDKIILSPYILMACEQKEIEYPMVRRGGDGDGMGEGGLVKGWGRGRILVAMCV